MATPNQMQMRLAGLLAMADLESGGFLKTLPPAVSTLLTMTLPTTPAYEWDAWVKEKLQIANPGYWTSVVKTR